MFDKLNTTHSKLKVLIVDDLHEVFMEGLRDAGHESLHASDYTRCDAWVQRIKSWLDNGMEELYFFMHMHDEATSPELTVYLVDKMNAACGLNLSKPQFVNIDSLLTKPKQKGLFDQ